MDQLADIDQKVFNIICLVNMAIIALAYLVSIIIAIKDGANISSLLWSLIKGIFGGVLGAPVGFISGFVIAFITGAIIELVFYKSGQLVGQIIVFSGGFIGYLITGLRFFWDQLDFTTVAAASAYGVKRGYDNWKENK